MSTSGPRPPAIDARLPLHRKRLRRPLDSIIIHFDYDAFYASVVEAETPSLRTRPLAIQQKQIVVTCNYEARRRGLYKLQLIKEAKQICPDVVIVLGEDLTRFRNASKELYAFLRSFSWNSRCERLGFDEVWMDVTDMVDHNLELLNQTDWTSSFFCLSKTDPSIGFAFDASKVAGQTYPEQVDTSSGKSGQSPFRVFVPGAELESEKNHTCTAGISTNKLLTKLVGSIHKPNDQTTLFPPYNSEDGQDNVTSFIDSHEVGKIPGIGFKIAQKLRALVLQSPAGFVQGLVYGGTKEKVLVGDVRKVPDIGPEALEHILGGAGAPHGIGAKTYGLLSGVDDSEVGQARDVPTQISLEDSYIRLDTISEVKKQLLLLSGSLLRRMHADLLEEDEDVLASVKTITDTAEPSELRIKRWMAFPKTLRLTTRPRPPQNSDGSRNRSFARTSRSGPMPNFVFNLKDDVDTLAERLVAEALLRLFRRLHPEKSGWNLSLVNVAATNMVDAASEKGGVGRDISKMFKRQDRVLKDFQVTESDDSLQVVPRPEYEMMDATVGDTNIHRLSDTRGGSEDLPTPSQEATFATQGHWESEDDDMLDEDGYACDECGAVMPLFAMGAHARWHSHS
ncbi:DNA/RNA polymerase [Karstenula rhodostoma CBS 690.94]|uniref:DNA/RNA polymerase n=1 Tax=Karstenula rhodostoma CBS 690.94 TaxID=1392251 RepID=A0A9P4PNG0_9PLEO|nr:DNA/RNA polymerase [Karstenula rhodostoma CBS 690.94]